MVDDPKYLQQPFVTSTHFRLEPDGLEMESDTVQDGSAGYSKRNALERQG